MIKLLLGVHVFEIEKLGWGLEIRARVLLARKSLEQGVYRLNKTISEWAADTAVGQINLRIGFRFDQLGIDIDLTKAAIVYTLRADTYQLVKEKREKLSK